MQQGGTTMHTDKQRLVEKLRALVSHPLTDDAIRSIGRSKLDILAPRRPQMPSGTLRRRASDRMEIVKSSARYGEALDRRPVLRADPFLNQLAANAYNRAMQHDVGQRHHDRLI